MKPKPLIQHIKTIFLLAAAIAGLSLSAKAQGTLTWDWSWSGDRVTGSGTLITTNATSGSDSGGFTGYQVLDITGTINNQTITALDAVNSFNGNDNLLSTNSPQLTSLGISFSTSTDQYLIYSEYEYWLSSASGHTSDLGISAFTATLVPVPEPSILALTALGGLSGCYFTRRRK